MHPLDNVVQKITAGAIGIGDLETIANFSLDKELVVELGTNRGTTAMFLSYCAKRVITIDVFERLDLIEDADQRVLYKAVFKDFHHTFNKIRGLLSLFVNIEVIQDLSYHIPPTIKDNSVDTIFIDADHSYVGAKKDFNSWFPKIKPHGHFMFHDAIAPNFGVSRYYNEELLKDSRIKLVSYTPAFAEFASIRVFEKVG